MGLDADGIPIEIDDEAVLRGDAIRTRIAAAADDQPFLVGGWATEPIAYRCPATSPDDPPLPALLACGAPAFLLAEGPGRRPRHVVVAAPPVMSPSPGRVVIRVHVHDFRAGQCEMPARAACESRLVLEAIVWADPAR